MTHELRQDLFVPPFRRKCRSPDPVSNFKQNLHEIDRQSLSSWRDVDELGPPRPCCGIKKNFDSQQPVRLLHQLLAAHTLNSPSETNLQLQRSAMKKSWGKTVTTILPHDLYTNRIDGSIPLSRKVSLPENDSINVQFDSAAATARSAAVISTAAGCTLILRPS